MNGGKVGGNLETRDAIFSQQVNMDDIQVDRNLDLSYGATFHGLTLVGAKVGGSLFTNGSTFKSLFPNA